MNWGRRPERCFTLLLLCTFANESMPPPLHPSSVCIAMWRCRCNVSPRLVNFTMKQRLSVNFGWHLHQPGSSGLVTAAGNRLGYSTGIEKHIFQRLKGFRRTSWDKPTPSLADFRRQMWVDIMPTLLFNELRLMINASLLSSFIYMKDWHSQAGNVQILPMFYKTTSSQKTAPEETVCKVSPAKANTQVHSTLHREL